MISKKLFHILLIAIISFILRFYELPLHPIHLSMDEAAITYNAYSIAKTGKDEWNQKLPLAFRSAGDYKPPVNIYLTAPITLIFGMNEFSSRFVSAFLGSLTPIILYLLLVELGFTLSSALLTSIWLAILPWHIHFSRASFEAITALFFVFSGLLFWFKWTKKNKPLELLIFIISFSLSVWSYHAERLYVPLLTIFLIISNHSTVLNNFKKINKNWLCLYIVVLSIFCIPFLKLTFFTPAVMTRASATSILRETSLVNTLHPTYLNIYQTIFDNNFYLIFKHWLDKYLNYFDFRFLFWKGMQFTPPQYPDTGLLFPPDLILFCLGVYFLLTKQGKKYLLFFLVLFLLGPLPASFTMNSQHPLRALTWIPAFTILFSGSFSLLLTKIKKTILIPALLIIYSTGLFYSINVYKNLFPYFFSEYWQYGYKEAAEYVCQNKDSYNKIIVSDTFGSNGPLNTGLPYLYILLSCNYPPSKFQQNQSTETIQYRRLDWKHDQFEKNMLIVASPWDILDADIKDNQIIRKIYFKNGKLAFLLIKTGEK